MGKRGIQAKIAQIVEDIIGREPLSSNHLVGEGLDSLAAMELRQKVQVDQIFAGYRDLRYRNLSNNL